MSDRRGEEGRRQNHEREGRRREERITKEETSWSERAKVNTRKTRNRGGGEKDGEEIGRVFSGGGIKGSKVIV